MVIQLTNAFYGVGELQAIEIGEATAVDAVPRVVAIKDAPEGEDDIISVKSAGRFKPVGSLELDLIAQVEAVGGAVIKHFPAFRQFRHQTIGIRVDVEQAIVDLGGEGVDNQAAADFCGLKVFTCPLTQ